MEKTMEKTYSINNFIGVYDNYITPEECNKAIKLFEEQDKFNNTLNRLDFEQAPVKLQVQTLPIRLFSFQV